MSGSWRNGKPAHQELNECFRVFIDDPSDVKASGRNGRDYRRRHPFISRLHTETASFVGSGGRIEHLMQKKRLEKCDLWFKVTIPHGGKYPKDYILKILMGGIAPTVFIPLRYQVRGAHSSFFVDDFCVAEKLASINKKITTCSGFKLLVKAKPGLPHMVIDGTLEEKMKAVIAKRYNAAFKSLDLTAFYKDADLTDIAVALFRPSLMLVALEIIEENFPDLAALDLCDNKLYSLDKLRELSIKLPELKVLKIGRNRIQDVHELNCLEGLRLEELELFGNPLCMKYHDHSAYVSDVRKRLPQLLKLDGIYISTLILADLIEDGLDLSRLSICDIREDSKEA
jgi:nuclear RNA export factor